MNKHLPLHSAVLRSFACVARLASVWACLCVCFASPALHAATIPTTSDAPTTDGAVFRIWNASYSTSVAIASNGYLARIDQSSADNSQYWTLEAQSDGTYALKNYLTNTYVQSVSANGTAYTMGSAASGLTVAQNTYDTGCYNIGSVSSYGFNATDQTQSGVSGYKVVSWSYYTGGSQNPSGSYNSAWKFEKVAESISALETLLQKEADAATAARDAVQAAAGETKPVASASAYYTIWNKQKGTVLAESGKALVHTANDASDLSQYWQLIEQTDGTIALLNAYTGHYVLHTGVHNSAYQMGTTAAGFTIVANEHYTEGYYYDIREDSSDGLNAASSGAVYSWTFYDGSNDLNSAWVFKSATLTDDQITECTTHKAQVVKDEALQAILSNGIIRLKSRLDGHYITDRATASGSMTCYPDAETTLSATDGDESWRQVWIAEASGSGFTLRNLKTGKYISTSNGVTSTSVTTFYFYWNADNADDESYVNISSGSTYSATDHTFFHYNISGWNGYLEYWNATTHGSQSSSDWLIEDVSETLTADIVKAQYAAFDGTVATPVAGTYYLIRNVSNNNVMAESYTDGQATVNERDTKNYAQLWHLVEVDGSTGYYNLQNALTGNYIQYAAFNAQHTVSAEATSGGFKLTPMEYDAVKYHSYYAFLTNANGVGTTYSLHRSSERLLTWTSYTPSNGITGSIWYFQASNVTDEEIAAAQAEYKTNVNERANASTYAGALSTFFADAACTTLRDEYANSTDDNLKTAMTNAGITSAALQAMALKIKNNTWATWEKTFRVGNVDPHSNPSTWHNSLKTSNIYCTIPNPTGVVVNTGGLAYIFVGGTIPTGCSMNVHLVNEANSQGSEVSLSEGLNIIPVSTTSALFVNYIVPTDMTDDSKLLSDFASIPLHIEGGWINGYFDLNRTEIATNAAWQQMKSDGLLTHDFMQMKGKYVMMNMNTSEVKANVGDNEMEEIVGFWDWVTKTEQNLMGVSQYRDRWNDMMGCYSTNSGYMYATSYGTYFNENTLSTVLNYSTMAASGGSLWGPAHEMGHNHQALINTIGTTEISNNLFSEVVVFLNGKTSTRSEGKSINSLADHFAAGDTWIDIQSDNWVPTRMYYQLYLYYEQLGYHPGFWADVFTALRSDGINKSGTQSNPCPATNDFLKLAVTCSQVAQEDLSEFFEAYCMFKPFTVREVGDYGTYYIENTQDMIDEAKAKMRQYAKPSGNILFVEDHIKQLDAIDHDGNLTGSKRGDYSSTDAVGKLGDVGSYTDFVSGNYASGYSYTYNSGTITLSSTSGTASESGAVGYKVYDASGNLLYFSNKNTFTLPSSVITALGSTTPVVKVAQADGTDVTLLDPSADKYTLTVYHADATADSKAQVIYTDGTTLPTLSANAIAFTSASETNIPQSVLAMTNVVDASTHTANTVTLTDKASFYTPEAFTATTLTYNRTNTAGWNSVCMPFAVSAADFGNDSKVETLQSLTTDDDGDLALRFSETESAAAGEPCLVYCPSDVTTWSIEKQNAYLTSEPADVSEGELTLTGSFVNKTIGQGKYKLNSAGTAFGITTAAGKVTAFRSYVATAEAAQGAQPRSLAIIHGDDTVTYIQTAVSPTSGATPIYDLSGRRVLHPVKGGMYIVGGKKVIQ